MNINVNIGSSYSKSKESIKSDLKTALEESGLLKDQADAIATKITANLKGKKNYTEEDVFKAANSIYGFDNGKNLGLRDGIDGLNNLYNVNYTTEAKTGDSKAIWEAISGSPDGDSRNIVSRSIGRLEKDKQDITVNNIIEDLETKGVFKDGQNPRLNTILKAMNKKDISPEQLKEAVKDDAKWLELIGNVKGAKPKSKPESP